MVLEKLFPNNWKQNKLRYTLLIGFVYSAISIIFSVFLFGKNSGLISVVLTSLLILPLLENLLKKEELVEEKEKSFKFKHLLKDNKQAIITYLLLFISIFFTYTLFVFIFHILKIDILSSFHGQLLLDFSKGGATFMFKNFWTILSNNWWVLLTIFVVSLFIKDGGVFFITWNASSWGVILAYRAITSATYTTGSSLKLFLILFFLSAPFLIVEALAYIMAAISGNIISKDVVKKSTTMHYFLIYSVIYGVIYFGLHLLINSLIPNTGIRLILQIFIVLIFLYFLSSTFKNKKHKEVFLYNYYLFVFAIIVFILGALIELLITQNVDILTKIYTTSLLFGG